MLPLLLLLFLMSGCELVEIPEGPQGDPGPAGEDGNANVLVKTITVTDDDYADGYLSAKHTNNTLFFFPAKIATIDDPDITQAIVDNGMVLAYIEVPVGLSFNPTQWVSLPYAYRHLNEIYTANYSSAYSPGIFSLGFFFTRNTDGTMPDIRDWVVPNNRIKYVIVSGSVAGEMAGSRMDLSDFDAVEAFLSNQASWAGSAR